MSGGGAAAPGGDEEAATPGGMEWRGWPLQRQPVRGALAALVLAGSVWGVWVWSGNAALTGLAVVVLSMSVGSFFVPTHYRLDDRGVTVVRPWARKTRPWTEFRGVRFGGEIILLSPSRRRSWLDGVRGVTLRVTERRREEVLDYVRKMVDQAEGSGDV
ncbi:hypothetical protein K8I85_02775 [bacterium]|nr:hypothetical protein [bacterium]